MNSLLDFHLAGTLLTVFRILGVGATVVFAAIGIYLQHQHH
jgi:hypothetical protein